MAEAGEAGGFFASLDPDFDTTTPLRWSFLLDGLSEGQVGPLMEEIGGLGFAEVEPLYGDEGEGRYTLWFAEVRVHSAESFAERVTTVRRLAVREGLVMSDFSTGRPDLCADRTRCFRIPTAHLRFFGWLARSRRGLLPGPLLGVMRNAGSQMTRAAFQIVADIRAFQPVGGNWRPLDDLFAELWATGEAGRYVADLLAVLERFPEDDGAGVLWSSVHGIESLPAYEPELVLSVRQRPSELGITMVGRLLNGGVSEIGGVCLFDLLRGVAGQDHVPRRVREVARDFANDHGDPD